MDRLFTVGHSNLTVEGFLGLIRSCGVRAIADIRRFPGSRTHPHFGRDPLAAWLAADAVRYVWMEGLGGRRKARTGHVSRNGGLTSESFRHYADYMETDAFRAPAAHLIEFGREQPTAVMCAEKLFWRCHRRLLSDYLTAQGVEVVHLVDTGRTVPHTLTPGAVITPEGGVRYPLSSP